MKIPVRLLLSFVFSSLLISAALLAVLITFFQAKSNVDFNLQNFVLSSTDLIRWKLQREMHVVSSGAISMKNLTYRNGLPFSNASNLRTYLSKATGVNMISPLGNSRFSFTRFRDGSLDVFVTVSADLNLFQVCQTTGIHNTSLASDDDDDSAQAPEQQSNCSIHFINVSSFQASVDLLPVPNISAVIYKGTPRTYVDGLLWNFGKFTYLKNREPVFWGSPVYAPRFSHKVTNGAFVVIPDKLNPTTDILGYTAVSFTLPSLIDALQDSLPKHADLVTPDGKSLSSSASSSVSVKPKSYLINPFVNAVLAASDLSVEELYYVINSSKMIAGKDGNNSCSADGSSSTAACFYNLGGTTYYSPFRLLYEIDANSLGERLNNNNNNTNNQKILSGSVIDPEDGEAYFWASSNVGLDPSGELSYTLVVFLPEQFIMGNIIETRDRSIIIFCLLVVFGAILVFLMLKPVISEIELLCEKMAKDPFDPSLIEQDDVADEESQQRQNSNSSFSSSLETVTAGATSSSSSLKEFETANEKNKKENNRHHNTTSRLRCCTINRRQLEEVSYLHSSFVELRTTINKLRAFMPQQDQGNSSSDEKGTASQSQSSSSSLVVAVVVDHPSGSSIDSLRTTASSSGSTSDDTTTTNNRNEQAKPSSSTAQNEVDDDKHNNHHHDRNSFPIQEVARRRQTAQKQNADDDEDDDGNTNTTNESSTVHDAPSCSTSQDHSGGAPNSNKTKKGRKKKKVTFSVDESTSNDYSLDQRGMKNMNHHVQEEEQDISVSPNKSLPFAWTNLPQQHQQQEKQPIEIEKAKYLVAFVKATDFFDEEVLSSSSISSSSTTTMSKTQIDKISQFVHSVWVRLILPHGAHLIEYRNDFFLLAIRLSKSSSRTGDDDENGFNRNNFFKQKRQMHRRKKSHLALKFIKNVIELSEEFSTSMMTEKKSSSNEETKGEDQKDDDKKKKNGNFINANNFDDIPISITCGLSVGNVQILRMSTNNNHNKTDDKHSGASAQQQQRQDLLSNTNTNNSADSNNNIMMMNRSINNNNNNNNDNTNSMVMKRPLTLVGDAVSQAVEAENFIRFHLLCQARQKCKRYNKNKSSQSQRQRQQQGQNNNDVLSPSSVPPTTASSLLRLPHGICFPGLDDICETLCVEGCFILKRSNIDRNDVSTTRAAAAVGEGGGGVAAVVVDEDLEKDQQEMQQQHYQQQQEQQQQQQQLHANDITVDAMTNTDADQKKNTHDTNQNFFDLDEHERRSNSACDENENVNGSSKNDHSDLLEENQPLAADEHNGASIIFDFDSLEDAAAPASEQNDNKNNGSPLMSSYLSSRSMMESSKPIIESFVRVLSSTQISHPSKIFVDEQSAKHAMLQREADQLNM